MIDSSDGKETKQINLQKRFHYRGRLEQTLIYLGKLFRMFIYQNDWKALPMAALIAGLVTFVVGQNLYVTQEGTLTGCFALVCICVWNGFFNSIQVVCRERGVIKREHRAGLHITSYIAAHMIYQACLCAAQVLITIVICRIANITFPARGLVTNSFILDLAITLFLITYAADILSLMVSCMVNNTTTAMTVMPFLLIFQLLFSGGFFELKGPVTRVSDFTVSKWGLNSLCAIGNYNKLGMVTLWNTVFKFRNIEVEGEKPLLQAIKDLEQRNMVDEIVLRSGEYNQSADYVSTAANVTNCWFHLILFIVIFAVLAVLFLEFIDKDKR